METLLNSLDILTFVVPPILPAALTANNWFAQKRLEKQDIFCLHSKHISLCGGIDVCAFDKVSFVRVPCSFIHINIIIVVEGSKEEKLQTTCGCLLN